MNKNTKSLFFTILFWIFFVLNVALGPVSVFAFDIPFPVALVLNIAGLLLTIVFVGTRFKSGKRKSGIAVIILVFIM